ncbi:hypothetical protein [Rhizobium rhizogenes]|uniref:hypothetical protein n=1 Tax=Rhizobium rhizogenes TaxID=359 RepID=UPI00226D67E7|nr:hypothetical protein [Rhizobium rhizogenes]
MIDLTLEEKTNYAKVRAAEEAAGKHFYDANQPFFPLGFSIGYRNPGHWDIVAKECPGRASAWLHAHPGGFTSEKDGERRRAFRIRGEPGNVIVYDERWNPHREDRQPLNFKSVTGAMVYIIEELMQEPTP